MALGESKAVANAADLELVKAARAGDSKAFASLYNRHAGAVHRLISRLIGPVSEREDILQEVFVSFHRSLSRFRGDSAVSTFVAKIAVNRCHDHLRARKRRREDPFEELEDAAIHDGRDRAIAWSDHLAVLRCLDKIRPKKRVAFVLRAACEFSYGEIAEILDVKPDTARQRVAHARRELERLLTAEGITHD